MIIRRKYNLGGDIGSQVGQFAGNFIPIPGVGPLIGKIGGELIGDQIGKLFGARKRKAEEERQDLLERSAQRVGVYTGGDPLTFALGGPVAKKKIRIKPENKGKFTASAKRAGMGVQAYANKVLSDPNASSTLKKRANFARNAAKWKKKAHGGPIDSPEIIKGDIVQDVKRGTDIIRRGIGNIGSNQFWRNHPTLHTLARHGEKAIEGFATTAANFVNPGAGVFNFFDVPTKKELNKRELHKRVLEGGRIRSKSELPIVQPRNNNKYFPRYAIGGSINNMKGGGAKITGRKHSKGGVKFAGIEAEGGETIDMVNGRPFIFSDRIKRGGKQTYADAHESGRRRGQGQQFVEDLADEQESIKQQMGAGQRFRIENQARRTKFQGGGILDDPIRRIIPKALTALGSHPGRPITVRPGPRITSDMLRQPPALTSSVSSANNVSANNVVNQDDSNFFNKLKNVGDFIGPATNILSGLLGANKPAIVNAPRNTEARSLLNQLPSRFNIEPQLQEDRQSLRALAANPNASANNLLAARSQSIQNRSRLLGQKENIENQMKSDRLRALAGVATEDVNRGFQADTMNAQERASSRAGNINLLTSGLGQFGAALQQRRYDDQLRAMEPVQLAAMLAGATPETIQYVLGLLDSNKAQEVIDNWRGQ